MRMPKTELNRHSNIEKVETGDSSLKGTLVSVFLVGVVIVVFWVGVYSIFSSRF